MSNTNAPNHYGSKFASRVIHFYQRERRLRDRVNSINLTDAKDYTFFRMGKTTSTERARGASLTAQNIDLPVVKVTPVETSALHFQDRQDRDRLTYNQFDELAKSLAMQLGRASDAQIIAAVEAGDAAAVTASARTAKVFTTNPELEQLVEIMADLEERDVHSDGEITVLVSPRVYSHLLLFEAFASADFIDAGDRSLSSSTRIQGKYWNGGYIMKHRGLTKAGSGASATVDCLAFHRPAVGHVSLSDIRTETAPTLGTGLPGTNIYGYIDQAAATIDYQGVQKFTMKDVSVSA